MSNEEQVEYDTLYDKGFEDKVTDIEDETTEEVVDLEDEVSEDVEQPEIDSEDETELEDDDSANETTDDDTEDSITNDTYVVTHKGQDLTLTKDEMILLAQKGFDYTSKTQDLANKRKILDMLDGLDENTIKSAVDAVKGDKNALSYLAKQAGIDPYDIDEDTQYKPVVESRNYQLDDIIDDIKSDTVNGTAIDSWIQSLPSSTHSEFSKDPLILRDLHIEARNGMAQKVMPEVIKQMNINGNLSFKDAYLSARSKVASNDTPEPKKEVSREVKKKATVNKVKPSRHKQDHTDIWEDDDLYQKMQKLRRGY